MIRNGPVEIAHRDTGLLFDDLPPRIGPREGVFLVLSALCVGWDSRANPHDCGLWVAVVGVAPHFSPGQ